MMAIHAIILTLNEERHIARCIESIREQCQSITVVDSGSTDDTVAISQQCGVDVLSNAWVDHGTQINFTIQTLVERGGWLFRIDADEVLDKDCSETLQQAISRVPANVGGLVVQRRIYFLGQRIKHGSIEPSWQLRLWRNGAGRCEQRLMDEHIIVSGNVAKSKIVISDINLNSLTWWTEKHNKYASLEAIETLNNRYRLLAGDSIRDARASPQAKLKRFVKERIYLKIPSGGRALLYFLYRYFLRFGFLDGKAGFYFHMLQGLWYRTLVDAKVNEILAYAKDNNISLADAIRDRTNMDLCANFDKRAQHLNLPTKTGPED
jgi:glycosyltransferase involved in cell wall biosynthesis